MYIIIDSNIRINARNILTTAIFINNLQYIGERKKLCLIMLEKEYNDMCTENTNLSLTEEELRLSEQIFREVRENIYGFLFDEKNAVKQAHELRMSFGETHIKNENQKYINKKLSDVSILIITATEIERETLFAYFTYNSTNPNMCSKYKIEKIPNDGLVYSFFYINDFHVVHVEPEMTGSCTTGGTAQTLEKALKRVKPSVVISLGIAFGNNYNEQRLCDVLIGRQFFAYDKSVKITDKDLKIKKLHILESSNNLLYKIKSCILFEDTITGRYKNNFKVFIGNMLTGEYVVDSLSFRNLIRSPFDAFGIIGGEMEAFGMFNALNGYKRRFRHSIEGVMIKGICDWGVGKNQSSINKSFKAYASEKKLDIPEFLVDTEDFSIIKNDLQVLAMCNTCSVCERLLNEKEFFSDFRIHGIKKCLWRFAKKLKSIFTCP